MFFISICLYVIMLASYCWHTLVYTRSHLSYDGKSRNGKYENFLLPFEGRNSIKPALEMDIICYFDFCYYRRNGFWSSNWVGFTKDNLEFKV